LGYSNNGFLPMYNWTLPTHVQEPCIANNSCNCVLRLRYNVSTGDLNVGGTLQGNNPFTDFIDSNYNGANSPVQSAEITSYSNITFEFATNTESYGTVYQDRSFVFNIRPRAQSNIPDNANIYNINVRGKRGNYIQTFPTLEYGFVPDVLYVQTGDYIHFQWTGCDTNPAGNAGEGIDQTDRSNIVQISTQDTTLPATDSWLSQNTPLFETLQMRQSMALINQDLATCLPWSQLLANNGNSATQANIDPRNCMKLNAAASPYFDGGAIRMNHTTGDVKGLYYMSSRSNNFPFRQQKGAIYVLDSLPPSTGTTSSGTTTGCASSSTTKSDHVSSGTLVAPVNILAILIFMIYLMY